MEPKPNYHKDYENQVLREVQKTPVQGPDTVVNIPFQAEVDAKDQYQAEQFQNHRIDLWKRMAVAALRSGRSNSRVTESCKRAVEAFDEFFGVLRRETL